MLGVCDCCGTFGPLAASLFDGAPLCAECRAAEWDGAPGAVVLSDDVYAVVLTDALLIALS